MVANKFGFVVVFLCIIAVGLTLLVWKLFKRKRAYKYIPSIFLAGAGIASLIKSIYFSESFQDIAYLLLAIMSAFMFAASLITAIIIDVVNKKNHK